MLELRSPEAYYTGQQAIAATTAAAVRKLWARVGDDFDLGWQMVRRDVMVVADLGRAAAVSSSLGYTAAALEETDQIAPGVGALNPARFLDAAPDGRPLASLLDQTPGYAKAAVGRGSTAAEALQSAGSWLTGTLLTVLADTGRAVVSADIAQRPRLTGYTRMLNPPSCERCVILAGKWFRWNQGFLRHPRCDCRHVPSSEALSGDLATDPYAYFQSLDATQQEKLFGRSEARAIREGADIYRVVNIKARGLGTAKSALKYGTPSRMTVDDIFRVAGTRTNAIRLLTQEGFITGPQRVGGNLFRGEGFGQLGKGGRARAATDAIRTARATGVRDPLNRYTMTAAERRLYDAKTRLDVARTGVYPRSIGANSADRFTKPRPITPTELATIQKTYDTELAKLATAPESVRILARALGIL